MVVFSADAVSTDGEVLPVKNGKQMKPNEFNDMSKTPNTEIKSGANAIRAYSTLIGFLTALAPWVIIGVLLWAGLFIKPVATTQPVEPPVIDRRDHFYGVSYQDSDYVWAVGSKGKIIRTDAKNENWSQQSSGTSSHLQSIATWDSRSAVVVGNSGTVLVTADQGETWRSVDAPKSEISNKFLRVRIFNDNSAWIVGELGAILQSTDKGLTWNRMRPEEDIGWNDVASKNGQRILVVGERGRILLSEDQGSSWLEMDSQVTSSLTAVKFGEGDQAVAVGLEGVVITSDDGGRTWRRAETNVLESDQEHLFDVAWLKEENSWVAVGNQGMFLKAAGDANKWQFNDVFKGTGMWMTHIDGSGSQAYVSGRGLAKLDLQAMTLKFSDRTN